MNFTDAVKVKDTIAAGDAAARVRSDNRAKVTNQGNGMPPLDDEAAKKLRLQLNVNWMEYPLLLAQARRQYFRSLYGTNQFFTIDEIKGAPVEKEIEWRLFMTQFINEKMRDSRPYFCLNQNRIAALVLHGMAPTIWWDKDDWMRRFVALDDFRVPTDTEVSFINLEWFAVRIPYTEGELSEKVFGPTADKYWNKKQIAKILDYYRNQNYTDIGSAYSWLDSPEKVVQLVKQNIGYYSSDAVPTIPLWHFFHKVREKRKDNWYLKVVPDWTTNSVNSLPYNEFLYECEEPEADDLSQILHVQFGDLNNATPQKVLSIRSLGFELFDPCFWSNLMTCRSIQHLMESFNAWFRVTDPAGKARAQKIEMYDKAILPEGVTLVPNTERHQVDGNLLQLLTAQMKQKMAEASAAYTQQADTGTAREQTAYETAVKMSQVNAMMEGLLLMFAFQETESYQEICRRFCATSSSNDDVMEFRKACQQEGIPERFINADLWKVVPSIPIGAGNPALAISQANQLLGMRPMFNPQAQQEILHEATAIIVNDPRKAARWAPVDAQPVATTASKQAESDFNTCMNGAMPQPRPDLSLGQQVDTLLSLFEGVVAGLVQSTGMASQQQIIGFTVLNSYITMLLQQLSQDEQQTQAVKMFGDRLGKLMNEVKAFAQRLHEQSNTATSDNSEGKAKIEAMIIGAQAKARISEEKASQTRKHKEVQFLSGESREDQRTKAIIERENAIALGEAHNDAMRQAAEPAPAKQ